MVRIQSIIQGHQRKKNYINTLSVHCYKCSEISQMSETIISCDCFLCFFSQWGKSFIVHIRIGKSFEGMLQFIEVLIKSLHQRRFMNWCGEPAWEQQIKTGGFKAYCSLWKHITNFLYISTACVIYSVVTLFPWECKLSGILRCLTLISLASQGG